MATSFANDATLAESSRADTSLFAPGSRPRSISVLPTVHNEGVQIQLTHEAADRYRSLEVLGTSGMGVVERAEGLDVDGRYFFVMKYVEGQTLADIIERLAAGDPPALAFWTS